ALERSLLACEELDEVEGAARVPLTRHARWQPAQNAIVTLGRIDDGDARAGLDAQLLDKRLAGVPRHLYRPLPPIAVLYRPLYITRQILPAASSVMYREPSAPNAPETRPATPSCPCSVRPSCRRPHTRARAPGDPARGRGSNTASRSRPPQRA